MIVASDPQARQLAGRILLWQSVVTLAGTLVAAALAGRDGGASALAGGLIGLIANLYMTWAALRPAPSAGLALGRLVIGQFVKVLLTVGLFLAVAPLQGVVWPALIAGYLATLAVFWVVPVLSAPRPPPRSKSR